MPRRRSSRSRRRCSGVKKANCHSGCTWVPRQGCTRSDSTGNVAALAQMLGYASDPMNALGQLQQLNEAAKARAVAKIAAAGTQSTTSATKYAASPSAQLSTSLASLSASAAGSVPLPLGRTPRSFSLSPEVAAQVKQVVQASASPSALSSTVFANAASVAALQRSLSPSAKLRLGQDVVSPSVKAAVEQAIASNNYAALSKVSPGVLSAVLAPPPAAGLSLSARSMCKDLPRSMCVGPTCQQYKVKGRYKCRANPNPNYASLLGLF